MRIISWNVNGLRANVENRGFLDVYRTFAPDFTCLQETKMFPWQRRIDFGEVYEFWNPSSRKGLAGTAILTGRRPLSMTLDMGRDLGGKDGRVIALEYGDFILITVYVPSGAGTKEALESKLAWLEPFVTYVGEQNQRKPVILCGDMNIAHQEVDARFPDPHSAGFTEGERAVITQILNLGFVDAFRLLHPQEKRWSWLGTRYGGGLRLDYFFVSGSLESRITRAEVLRELTPTDHCPILLELDLPSG